jgi:hypothetical protein
MVAPHLLHVYVKQQLQAVLTACADQLATDNSSFWKHHHHLHVAGRAVAPT